MAHDATGSCKSTFRIPYQAATCTSVHVCMQLYVCMYVCTYTHAIMLLYIKGDFLVVMLDWPSAA